MKRVGKWIVLGTIAVSGAATAQAPHKAMGPALIGNVAEWFGPDVYPAEALRDLRQGRVVAAIGVDLTGRAASCRIVVPSGTTSLDKATCDIALEHAVFNPATDKHGRPIMGTYLLPVRWVLPERKPEEAGAVVQDHSFTVQLVADADGTTVSCRVLASSEPKDDACGRFRAGQKIGSGWRRNGRPVGATIILTGTTKIVVDP